MIPSTQPVSYPLTNELWTSPDALPRWQKVAAKIALLVPVALTFLFELCKPFFKQASLEIQVLKQKITSSPCPHLIDEMTQEEALAIFPRIPLQSLTQPDSTGKSALHQAILLGNTPIFIELLVRFPKEALKIPYKGLTPFQMACTLGRKEMGMALIDRLDPEDLMILINGTNPLFFLLGENQTDLAVHLIRKLPKEHLTVVNKNKSTLLHEAIFQDELRILDALIEKVPPSALNAPGNLGITPLLSAIYLNKKEAAQALIRKLDPQDFLNTENNHKTSVLFAALLHGSTDAVLAMIHKLSVDDFRNEQALVTQILYHLNQKIRDPNPSPELPEARILQALAEKGIGQIFRSTPESFTEEELVAESL